MADFAEVELDAAIEVFAQALFDDGTGVAVGTEGWLRVDVHRNGHIIS